MILGFGEIMMRMAPGGHLRWRQCLPGPVHVTWGGGEANVCASLAMLGAPSRFITALPANPLSEGIQATLRGLGVDTQHILWRKTGRVGIYLVESGANQRGSTVLYDREYSAISLAKPEEYHFDAALDGVTWLHVTGITPAISEQACQSNLALVKRAKQRGVRVSCDLNFRKKLWTWRSGTGARQLAGEMMPHVLEHVDLLIANEEDAADVLGIHAGTTDVTKGQLDVRSYEQVAREIVARFSSIQLVAITLRESLSADHNNWGGLLYDAQTERTHLAPLDADGRYQPYEIRDIVDRVGGGDSFAAGLLYALTSQDLSSPEQAIRFAIASSCLKHSILGDFNYVTKEEVIGLMGGNASGRVVR